MPTKKILIDINTFRRVIKKPSVLEIPSGISQMISTIVMQEISSPCEFFIVAENGGHIEENLFFKRHIGKYELTIPQDDIDCASNNFEHDIFKEIISYPNLQNNSKWKFTESESLKTYNPKDIFVISNYDPLIHIAKNSGCEIARVYREGAIDPTDIDLLNQEISKNPTLITVYIDVDSTVLNHELTKAMGKTILNDLVIDQLINIKKSSEKGLNIKVEFNLLTSRVYKELEIDLTYHLSTVSVEKKLNELGIFINKKIFTGLIFNDQYMSRPKIDFIEKQHGKENSELIILFDDSVKELNFAHDKKGNFKNGSRFFPIQVYQQGDLTKESFLALSKIYEKHTYVSLHINSSNNLYKAINLNNIPPKKRRIQTPIEEQRDAKSFKI